MASLPSPPFLDVEGIPNFRDCGGYPVKTTNSTQQPRSIRRNYLYRSADTGRVTPSGKAAIRENAKITKIFDLRSLPEVRKGNGPQEVEGVERVWAPVFEEREYSPEVLAVKMRPYLAGGPEACFVLSPLNDCST